MVINIVYYVMLFNLGPKRHKDTTVGPAPVSRAWVSWAVDQDNEDQEVQSWEEEDSIPIGEGSGLNHREGKQDSSSMKSGCKKDLAFMYPAPVFPFLSKGN